MPVPGGDAANPVLYKRVTGADGGGAVYVLTEGAFWCMLAESEGEAALFDAPEGMRRRHTTVSHDRLISVLPPAYGQGHCAALVGRFFLSDRTFGGL